MVKPFKQFLFAFIVMLILATISIAISTGKITVGSLALRYPSLQQLLGLDSAKNKSEFTLVPELARLERYIDSISNNPEVDTSFLQNRDKLFANTDSLSNTSTDSAKIVSTKSITVEILKNTLVPIELPDSTFSSLSSFFNALTNGQTNKHQVRIMHYGDSQIEGDRITSFLRLRLQSRFGGSGVGLLHAVPHSYQPGAIYQTISNNWEQTLISDLGKGAVEHRFGLLGGYSIFEKRKKFSKGGFGEAYIDFERRGKSQNARNFSQCRIFYGKASEPFMLSIQYGPKTQEAEIIAPTNEISSMTWRVPLDEKSIRIDFKGDESPLVYGVSLESPAGIIVDNIAIRGSSGVDFTRADDKSLKQALGLVNPSLIILQFGVNVVPHIVKSYDYYENQLYQQMRAIKRAHPKVSIILIGVSDMARRENGVYVSYPNIELIRNAQRNAAFRAGAAFWDCFTAMGGKNSVPAWAFASPPLASKDFVHFTLRGSNLVAEMFYSSLMQSYNSYIQQNE